MLIRDEEADEEDGRSLGRIDPGADDETDAGAVLILEESRAPVEEAVDVVEDVARLEGGSMGAGGADVRRVARATVRNEVTEFVIPAGLADVAAAVTAARFVMDEETVGLDSFDKDVVGATGSLLNLPPPEMRLTAASFPDEIPAGKDRRAPIAGRPLVLILLEPATSVDPSENRFAPLLLNAVAPSPVCVSVAPPHTALTDVVEMDAGSAIGGGEGEKSISASRAAFPHSSRAGDGESIGA